MLKNAAEIFGRYIDSEIISTKEIDVCHADDDRRYVYIVEYRDNNAGQNAHIVFKFAANSFTTPERVLAWKKLIELYNQNGIYAPKILCDKYGRAWNEYTEDGVKYIVYAEEKKKYKTTDEFGIAPSDMSLYLEDIVKAEATIAKCSTELPAWKSAWCLYDKFCDEDETDETYYWQESFYNTIKAEMPELEAQAERIWERFLSLYGALEKPYRALTQSFFQGDAGGLNVMLDENKRFAGLLDFNIAGAETVLNYFFRMFCRVRISRDEITNLNNSDFRRSMDNTMKRRLELVKKYYPFNEAEKAVFPLYYKTVYPLDCDFCQLFESVVRQKDVEKVQIILDWIEYQQTRDDIEL